MHKIYFGKVPGSLIQKERKYFLLTTPEIYRLCFGEFEKLIPEKITWYPIFIRPGETHKTLSTAEIVFEELIRNKAAKADLLCCLGGGMITDIGGYCASVYKRGMNLIHVPTSLLAMVDAAIGGKNGLNVQTIKNAIGTVYFPASVIIHPPFLRSLPYQEWQNGLTEIYKIALVRDRKFFLRLCNDAFLTRPQRFIRAAVELKMDVASRDPFEKKLRKVLNFGHTFGHALEAVYARLNRSLPHGKAVATGMILESFLSFHKGFLNENDMTLLAGEIRKRLSLLQTLPDAGNLYESMLNDKKNKYRVVHSVGLKSIGVPLTDVTVTKDDVKKCLKMYEKWIR